MGHGRADAHAACSGAAPPPGVRTGTAARAARRNCSAQRRNDPGIHGGGRRCGCGKKQHAKEENLRKEGNRGGDNGGTREKDTFFHRHGPYHYYVNCLFASLIPPGIQDKKISLPSPPSPSPGNWLNPLTPAPVLHRWLLTRPLDVLRPSSLRSSRLGISCLNHRPTAL